MILLFLFQKDVSTIVYTPNLGWWSDVKCSKFQCPGDCQRGEVLQSHFGAPWPGQSTPRYGTAVMTSGFMPTRTTCCSAAFRSTKGASATGNPVIKDSGRKDCANWSLMSMHFCNTSQPTQQEVRHCFWRFLERRENIRGISRNIGFLGPRSASDRLGEWRSAAQLLEKTGSGEELQTAVTYYQWVWCWAMWQNTWYLSVLSSFFWCVCVCLKSFHQNGKKGPQWPHLIAGLFFRI